MTLASVNSFCSDFICRMLAYLMVVISFSYVIFHKSAKNELNDLFDLIFRQNSFLTVAACILSTIILLFGSNSFMRFLDQDNIKFMPEGQYCYYVDATAPDGKNYTLPALIRVELVGDNEPMYSIEEVHFSNGGYLYFDYGELSSSNSHPGKMSSNATDQNGNEWEIILTDSKGHHPNIHETKLPKIPWSAFISSLIVWAWGFLYMRHIKELKKA